MYTKCFGWYGISHDHYSGLLCLQRQPAMNLLEDVVKTAPLMSHWRKYSGKPSILIMMNNVQPFDQRYNKYRKRQGKPTIYNTQLPA